MSVKGRVIDKKHLKKLPGELELHIHFKKRGFEIENKRVKALARENPNT